ncbi:type II toxin-antitoxin system RelE/ParE family toxin [Candidatus Entotheonella palauensis]|nr:type II toxin-antitoxin system RelE/ParE family toxin [Candidatus Entotheonella palauensis]
MIIRPEAEADLFDARDWYERQRNGLGREFLLCVEEVIERIRRTPEMYAVTYRDVRRALIRRFPYAIYYRIEVTEVVVLSILHTRRDPREWQSRI